jgi:hypothetical protein
MSYRALVKTRQRNTNAIPHVLRGGKASFEVNRCRIISKYLWFSSDELNMRGACVRKWPSAIDLNMGNGAPLACRSNYLPIANFDWRQVPPTSLLTRGPWAYRTPIVMMQLASMSGRGVVLLRPHVKDMVRPCPDVWMPAADANRYVSLCCLPLNHSQFHF